jgi:S-adenosylmethionine:tRNA ribosyltransferase-isomerase
MRAASEPRGRGTARRLAVVDPRAAGARLTDLSALATLLRPGDLLVVNDAATLPASLRVEGEALELRLLRRNPGETWEAVLFGAGDWRTRTEHRPAPRRVQAGEVLRLPGELSAQVVSVDPSSTRRLTLRFEPTGGALWEALYRAGRVVQYSHLSEALELWDVQTAYAARPWAMEAPSAGLPLSWELLFALRRGGVSLAPLTEACGLSATGDPALDAALPLTERFEIPAQTLAAIEGTRARGGRVIAAGTSVVRALETWGLDGRVAGDTALRIGPGHTLRVVDGILSGLHQAGESHFALLQAFAPATLLGAAVELADAAGLLAHEFGDAMLVLPGALEGMARTEGEPEGRISASVPGAPGRRSRCPAAG